MLPQGYYLEWREDGTAALRRPDHTIVAYFGEDASGAGIQDVARADENMRNDMLDAVYADLERIT